MQHHEPFAGSDPPALGRLPRGADLRQPRGMVQKKARHPFKDEAERRFPHKVDVPVPELDLGRDLTDMLEWCRARVPQPAWAYHGHTARLSKRAAPIHSARWYFR
jgi:hypothetical protein